MLNSQQIIDPFILFCRKDLQFLDRHTAYYKLETPEQSWHFKLHDLYKFLLHLYALDDYGFKHFRRTLFNSPVNQRLKEHGYAIAIAEPAKHVDDNLYALIPIEQH